MDNDLIGADASDDRPGASGGALSFIAMIAVMFMLYAGNFPSS